MSRQLRLVLLIVGGFALAVVLAAVIAVYLLLQPERFTRMLQTQAHAAGLELNGGSCTGRLSDDPTGRKLEALAGLGGIEYAISDNFSDAPLLKAARKGVAVVHDPRKRRFWQDLGLELIDLTV